MATKAIAVGLCLCASLSAQDLIMQLTLPEAERMLAEQNLAVAGTRYQSQAAEAARLIAGYKPNPTLQLGAEQFPFWSPLAGSYPRFYNTNSDAGAQPTYSMQLQKLFERGGKREARIEQAQALVDASKSQIGDTLRTQLLALRQAFTAALLARENLNLAQSIDNQYQYLEELSDTRVKAGDLAAVDLYRLQAARLPFQQSVLDAETAYQQALRDVLNILNIRSTPGRIQLTGELAQPPITKTLAELRDLTVANRPDIQAAQSNQQAASAAVRVASAERTRDVSLSFGYQRVGNDHAAGVIASVPLFAYNDQKAGIAQAVAQQRHAQTALNQLQLQALTDVEKAYLTYQNAQRALALYNDQNLRLIREIRQIMDYSYQRGEASIFELLEAQRNVSQSGVAHNQALANYQNALWQLESAVGASIR